MTTAADAPAITVTAGEKLPIKPPLFVKAVLLAVLPVLFYATWYVTHSRKITVFVILVSVCSGLFSYWASRDARKKL